MLFYFCKPEAPKRSEAIKIEIYPYKKMDLCAVIREVAFLCFF